MATNPYLPQQAQAVTQQANNNLFNYQLPGINSGAIAAGGFGGSRHGIAQGLAIGQTNQGLSSALANMSANAWDADQNRALQNKSLDNSYNLGLGNLDLGRTQTANNYSLGQGQLALGNKQADNSYGLGLGQLGLNGQVADQNFYTQQRGQDLSAYSLGSSLANAGNLGLSNQGQQLFQNGQAQQQAPFNVMQQYGQMLSPFTGLNQSQSQSTPGGSTLGGALGGALTAAQIWALLNKGG